MLSTMRRLLAVLVLVPMLMAMALFPAVPEASAAPSSPRQSNLGIKFRVNVTTHVAKSNMDVTFPQGTFVGNLNTTTWHIKGTLSLPPAQDTVSVLGVGLATATLLAAPTRPVTGQLDFQTGQLTSTSVFNLDITSLTVLGLPINLVGSNCATSSPIHATISGQFNLGGSSTYTGTYTIPPLANCGLLTPALNLLIPGPGNTLTAVFTFAP